MNPFLYFMRFKLKESKIIVNEGSNLSMSQEKKAKKSNQKWLILHFPLVIQDQIESAVNLKGRKKVL